METMIATPTEHDVKVAISSTASEVRAFTHDNWCGCDELRLVSISQFAWGAYPLALCHWIMGQLAEEKERAVNCVATTEEKERAAKIYWQDRDELNIHICEITKFARKIRGSLDVRVKPLLDGTLFWGSTFLGVYAKIDEMWRALLEVGTTFFNELNDEGSVEYRAGIQAEARHRLGLIDEENRPGVVDERIAEAQTDALGQLDLITSEHDEASDRMLTRHQEQLQAASIDLAKMVHGMTRGSSASVISITRTMDIEMSRISVEFQREFGRIEHRYRQKSSRAYDQRTKIVDEANAPVEVRRVRAMRVG
jgi:hypothetical protein